MHVFFYIWTNTEIKIKRSLKTCYIVIYIIGSIKKVQILLKFLVSPKFGQQLLNIGQHFSLSSFEDLSDICE